MRFWDCASPIGFICHLHKAILTTKADFETPKNIFLDKKNRIIHILYIIAKNMRFLHRNRGAWRSFHNTNQTFLAPCIRCADHLWASCGLTDVNPHFAAPGSWFYFKIKCLPIVTSFIHEPVAGYCDATMADCSPRDYHWDQWVNTSVTDAKFFTDQGQHSRCE